MKKKNRRKNSIGSILSKINSDKTSSRIAYASMGILVITVVLCIIHVTRIVAVFDEVYREKISDRVEICNTEVMQNVSRKADFLSTASATLATVASGDKQSVIETLDAIGTTNQFETLSFIRRSNSTVYYADGSVERIDYDDFESSLKPNVVGNSAYLVDKFISPGIVQMAVPVIHDGIKEGYLLGTMDSKSQMADIFDGEASSTADAMLIDGTGYIICSGSENKYFRNYAGKNFYDDVLPMLIGDKVDSSIISDEFKMNIFSGIVSTYDVENGEYGDVYIVYAPVPKTHSWAIVFCLFSSTLNQLLRPVIIEAFAAVAAILVIILLIAGLGLRYADIENRKIHNLAYTDELTDAPNENAFKERAKELLEDNPDIPYVIASFDISNFRYINEGYGHEKADILLKAVSQSLRESLSYNETYARIGADRFVSLTVDDGRDEERRNFIDEYIAQVSSNIMLNYPVRIKTGIYWVSNREESISSMMDKANLARKAISADSKDLTLEYVDRLMEETRKQEQIESRMEMALANCEFVPYLQPKWNMEKDCICGAEALVRWRRLDGSIVPPGDFIPLFEKNGFIEKLDFYMLDAVCSYIREMLDAGREVYPVSINQSRFLMHNPEYVSKVQQILLKYKIPSGLIELEITETVFTHDRNHMLEVMNKLKDFNMELSMDDFGSGYSSLNLLRDIPFDVLKIDRGFLDESTQTESGKWILQKIVEMAEGLNLRVICEGVETKEQVKMLLEVGCIYAQGFLYSRPIPIDEFIEKYNTVK